MRPGGQFSSWCGEPPSFVLCDVDGTLIGSEHLATNRVVTAIATARRSGLRVGIATGRMRTSVDVLRSQLGADGPHVFHNGAEFQVDGHTEATWTLAPDDVDALIAIGRTRDDCYVEICTTDRLYVSSNDERAAPHWEMLGVEHSGIVTTAAQLDDQLVVKATLVAFGVSGPVLDELTQVVTSAGLAVGAAHSPRTPGLFYLNVTHPSANKGSAAERAARAIGLDLAQVAAIGDALNDLPLFARAGTSIAMGQAPEEVIDQAHLVAPPVDDDGAAVALEALASWRQRAVRAGGHQDEPGTV
ncbi:MAG: HAD family hydrolase [Nitriliruptoraceae bacterium]